MTFFKKCFLDVLDNHMLHYIILNFKIMTWIYEVLS
jgi:hypothetical protein